jgi:hypothetical protein
MSDHFWRVVVSSPTLRSLYRGPEQTHKEISSELWYWPWRVVWVILEGLPEFVHMPVLMFNLVFPFPGSRRRSCFDSKMPRVITLDMQRVLDVFASREYPFLCLREDYDSLPHSFLMSAFASWNFRRLNILNEKRIKAGADRAMVYMWVLVNIDHSSIS